MFNKKAKRNFRQRKEESSDEDDGKKDREVENGENETPVSVLRPLGLSKSRGISCSSRRKKVTSNFGSSDDEEPADQKKETVKVVSKQTNVLSFTDEKEDGNYFKVKRSADKAVVFRARKKEDSPEKEVPSLVPKEDAVLMTGSLEEESGGVEAAEGVNSESDGDTSSQTSSSSRTSATLRGVIPDARQIRAARKQRRQARARQDFIPLDGDQHGMEEEAEEDHSEDSDDGTDDHQRTIQFAPKLKTIKERIAETIGDSEDEDDSADSEEENDRNVWEEQQIGKGIKRHKLSSCDYSQGSVKHKKKVDIPETLPAVTIDVIKRRITGKLESLREVHRAREADLRRMQFDMECAQASLEQLQSSSSDEQHRFYKAMRSYVQNLVECLTEKTVVINSVEMDMHTLLIDQAEVLLNRRREAVHKESSHLQQLAYSADPSSNGTEEKQKESQPCNLEAACKGVPADSEPLPDEKAELECKTADILKRAQDIFSDVQDEFSSVKKILAKFNEWRVLYPESYYNAYISFCIPKLLSPIIRHQLIGWNPLKADGEDFEALPWYYAVEDFCHGQGYEELENTDRETLPLIVQKTILPKVQGFVELVWDPLSSEQSLCLTKLCRRLNNDYMVFGGEQSKQGKAFMDAVTVRLRNAVDEDVFIPLYPKKFLEDTSSQQFQFQDRQFWSAVKLLGNITLWDGLVPDNVLMELALDKLLNRYVMMILLNTPPGKESVEKFKKVAACFPKSWFQDVDTRSSIPQLRNFSSHLVQTTHSLCKNNPDATCIRETVKDVFVLLGRIKALNSVATIAEKYHYEDISNSLNLL